MTIPFCFFNQSLDFSEGCETCLSRHTVATKDTTEINFRQIGKIKNKIKIKTIAAKRKNYNICFHNTWITE